jgi:hypothetical protein
MSIWSRSTSLLAAVRRLRTAAEARPLGALARSQISLVRPHRDVHGLRVGAYLLVVLVQGVLGVIRGAWRGAVVLGRVRARMTR